MNQASPVGLDRPVDSRHDHVLGPDSASITLVEYGSYACPYCHAAHAVITRLRDRFGDRMRYVFRHRPITGSEEAQRAAVLVEYANRTTGEFWPLHDALMARGAAITSEELDALAAQNAAVGEADEAAAEEAAARVRADTDSAHRSGASVSPTFFDHAVGPKPIMYWVTFTPKRLAGTMWPSSCRPIATRSPITNTTTPSR